VSSDDIVDNSGQGQGKRNYIISALHDSAAALLRVIIAHDLTGVPSEALGVIISAEIGIGDGRDRHRDAVPVRVYGTARYMPILCPFLLQIRQGFHENNGYVYVDLAIGVSVRRVNRRLLLAADQWVRSCYCCQANT